MSLIVNDLCLLAAYTYSQCSGRGAGSNGSLARWPRVVIHRSTLALNGLAVGKYTVRLTIGAFACKHKFGIVIAQGQCGLGQLGGPTQAYRHRHAYGRELKKKKWSQKGLGKWLHISLMIHSHRDNAMNILAFRQYEIRSMA